MKSVRDRMPHAVRPIDLRDAGVLELPRALASIHRHRSPGDRSTLRLPVAVAIDRLRDMLHGAGFAIEAEPMPADFCVIRVATLPDYVAPHLRLLVCGLNPSLHAAETGIPFSRPGNRFWPAALKAELVDVPRDCMAALARGIGFTDLVKRATRRAAEIDAHEYRAGLRRVAGLVRTFEPAVICFVGLEGYRRSVDAKATPGWIPGGFFGSPAYLMPSTSGLNARARVEDAARHLHIAVSGQRIGVA